MIIFYRDRAPEERFKFFNPNVCQVCKEIYNDNFETCDKCLMIYYCNDQHKLDDQESHTQICVVLHKLFIVYPFFWTFSYYTRKEWIDSRKQLMGLIKTELSRDLNPYEKQIIMLARSCYICHKQMNLDICKKCYNFNYCSDHADALINHSYMDCENFKKCLISDIGLSKIKALPRVKFVSFPDKVNKTRHAETMVDFLSIYVHIPLIFVKRFSTFAINHFYSDYATTPLTLYHQLKEENLFRPEIVQSCYIVHIIAANLIEKEYSPAWELLLHVSNRIKNLKIVLIGLKLENERGNLELCNRCTRRKQKLSFECHRMLYHSYVESDSYTRPNVIMGCQVDLNNWEMLSKTILKLRDQNCPLILTGESKLKVKQNNKKLEEILGSPLSILFDGINTFCSVKAYKNFENMTVARNGYLAIYKDLHVPSFVFPFFFQYAIDI